MTSSSGDPASAGSAHAKLSSARWRWLNSWWVVISPLTFGILGWLGFLVAAIQTEIRKFWIAAAVQLVLLVPSIVMMTVPDPESAISNIGVTLFLVAWLGPVVPSLIWNREYLTTLAHRSAWHQRGLVAPPLHAGNAAPTGFLGVDNSQYYGQTPTAPPVPVPQPAPMPIAPQTDAISQQEPIDINTATASQLTVALRIDGALANHVVAIRHAHGSFRDLHNLATAANLQPHQLVKFRNRVTFTMPDAGHSPQVGRIVDL